MGDEREWADVYIDSIDDRLALQRYALFFIPSALHLMSQNGITKNTLSTFSMNIKGKPTAGRQAVGKVADCLPVVYESAVGFVNAFNMFCEREGYESRLAKQDIVACVFRIEGFTQLLSRANITKAHVHEVTGIAANIIDSVPNNFRIQLSDAIKLFELFSKHEGIGQLRIDEFIQVSENGGRTSVKKSSDVKYVYKRENLRAAPMVGHPWAIK
jgi:hypothetical protein